MSEEENEVVIHISGGTVQVVRKPVGVAVRIRDYDAVEEQETEEVLELIYPGEKKLSQVDDEEINELASRIIREIDTGGEW